MDQLPIVRWETHEYHHTDKTADWYWTVGLVALLIVVLAVYFGNPLFAGVIAIGTIVLLLFASKKPDIVTHEITARGITVGQTLYLFDTINSFFVEQHEHHPGKLILASKRIFMPYIVISLEGTDPHTVREQLLKKLPEKEHRQSFFILLAEYLGF